MALSQDQFFERYWPSTEYYQQVQGYANTKLPGQGRYPTGGEIARIESSLKNAAKQGSSFRRAWSIYSAQQGVLAEKELLGKAQKELEATQKQAFIAGKKSAAVSSQVKAQTNLEQAQVQKAQQQTFQQVQRRKAAAGATVGQPGRSRTRVSSGLGIGGYGGTAAGRITSTGLNI